MVKFAIESVLSQSFADLEVIVVDDGGKDDTDRLVAAVSDPRVLYFKKENEERSIARNFGISKSRGRYVGFLDADDYLYNDHLETAYSLIGQNHAPEFLHLAYEMRDMRGRLVRTFNDFGPGINRDLAYHNTLSCNGVIVRRDILEAHQFIHDRRANVSEDWYLWLKLGARYQIHYTNRITSVIRIHDDRSLADNDPVKFEQSIRLVINSLDADDVVRQYFGRGYRYFKAESISLVALCYSERRSGKRKALKHLVQAVRYYPPLMGRRRFWAVVRNVVTHFRQGIKMF